MIRYYLVPKSIIFIFLVIFSAQAEVPNGSFESWNSVNPVGWQTTNAPSFFTNVTKSGDAHSGNYAVRGEVVEFSNTGLMWPPFLIAGDSTGFPITQNYSNLNGYYKFFPQGNDIMFIVVAMYSETSGVGVGKAELTASGDIYKNFDIPIVYYSDEPVTRCYIEIFAGDTSDTGNGGASGTYFLIDDVTLYGLTPLDDQESDIIATDFVLKQNYPNPFNPSTQIEFQLPVSSNVSLLIYNTNGVEVGRLLNNQFLFKGTHQVTWVPENLPSGMYFYKLIAGDYTQTRRMILLK